MDEERLNFEVAKKKAVEIIELLQPGEHIAGITELFAMLLAAVTVANTNSIDMPGLPELVYAIDDCLIPCLRQNDIRLVKTEQEKQQ